ncbi:MAG: Rpn family recombination-promoting nuclease/putative transposase [Prevotellaceae bacterium]|jgi:predicted transposase/invertase (TIGR01784 family)|nr:Rpn family recombination-promoting nuclease/putative transposase [Prevotellaceae bacterium]
MARYLDPKNDLTFKRIFGEHPDLLISFLNALMPLAPEQQIKSVKYLSPEQVPNNPAKKNSIVDVRCTDNFGRRFIVEMQMYWSNTFASRMLFNGAKAYVHQLDAGEDYELLQTVYGLCITNDIFDHKTAEFYHHYQLVNRKNTEEVIDGLEFVLVELPKFTPTKWSDRKMAVLWLRFLKEVKEQTRKVPAALLSDKKISKALTLCEEGAFTPEELAAYEKYWDIVSTEKALITRSATEGEALGIEKGRAEGRAEGEAIGIEKGRAIGIEKGRAEGAEEATRKVVLNALRSGIPIAQIKAITNLSEKKIREIAKS